MAHEPGSAEALQAARFSRVTRRIGQLVGANPLTVVEDNLGVGIELETDRPEWYALGGTSLACGGIARPAGGAGNFNKHRLHNPTGSGAIVVVTGIEYTATTAATVMDVRLTAGLALTGTTLEYVRDTRLNPTLGNSNLIGQISFEASVGTSGVLMFQRAAPLNTVQRIADVFVLGPGTGLEIADTVANQALNVSWFWYERAMEQAEQLIGVS